MKIGVYLPNWIGDVVMATPTLRAVRRRFPAAETIGVMKPLMAEVLAGTEWLDDIVFHNPKSSRAEHRSDAALAELRRRRLDLILLLTNSLRAGVFAWRSGAGQRVGYARNGRGCLLTTRRSFRHVPVPAVDYYLELAYAIGCPSESPRTELAVLPADEEKAARIWRALRLTEARQVVALNTGSAQSPARLWPLEYFAELARRVVQRSDSAVLVVCGPGEMERAEAVARKAAHPRVRTMADQDLGIGVAKACLRRCELLVSTDSGPRHLAAALGIPVIALLGPIDHRWAFTYDPRAVHLMQPVPCGPCGKHVCPLEHHACMRGLDVDRVWEAVRRQLAASAEAASPAA
jgi:heptosyltransferase II